LGSDQGHAFQSCRIAADGNELGLLITAFECDSLDSWTEIEASLAAVASAIGAKLLKEHLHLSLRAYARQLERLWRTPEPQLPEAAILILSGPAEVQQARQLLARKSGIAVTSGEAAVLMPRGVTAAGSQEDLTPREQEVLHLVTQGRSNRQIAELLCIAIKTVDYHLGNVYTKLGVHSRVTAASRARELGLVTADGGRNDPQRFRP